MVRLIVSLIALLVLNTSLVALGQQAGVVTSAPKKLGGIKIGSDAVGHAELSREKTAEFALAQLAKLIDYLFLAAVAILGLVVKSCVFDRRQANPPPVPLPCEERWLLAVAGGFGYLRHPGLRLLTAAAHGGIFLLERFDRPFRGCAMGKLRAGVGGDWCVFHSASAETGSMNQVRGSYIIKTSAQWLAVMPVVAGCLLAHTAVADEQFELLLDLEQQLQNSQGEPKAIARVAGTVVEHKVDLPSLIVMYAGRNLIRVATETRRPPHKVALSLVPAELRLRIEIYSLLFDTRYTVLVRHVKLLSSR